jgi:amino acid adenylation domain-containing protein
MFVFQNGDLSAPRLPGLESQLVPIDTGTSKFDLTLTIEQQTGGLIASIEYNVDLFDETTIRRMLDHFFALLEAGIAAPDQRLSELAILSEGERLLLTEGWNGAVSDYGQPECLHESVEEQEQRTPDAIAVVFEDQWISYEELNRRSNRLANHLQQIGAAAGKPVGILMERSPEMVVGLLAILKSGAPYLPLDPEYPRERIDYMLADAQPAVVLTVERLSDRVAGPQRLICVDELFESPAEASFANIEGAATVDDLAYVIYTSGSTGQPKGAMNTHRAIWNRLKWMQSAYDLGPSDAVLQKTPFSFDVSVWEFFWPLMTGVPLVLARPGGHQDPLYLTCKIREEGITTVHFVPSMLQVFLEEPEVSNCNSLRRVICSGEALTLDLQHKFFDRLPAELHNLYGPTEAAVDVTWWRCDPGLDRRSVPLGTPIDNMKCYVLDDAFGLSPTGVTGELHLAGVGLARGYLNRPDLTAEKFVPDPFAGEPGSRLYRTGDLARWSALGEIEYLGRSDNQVKIRGFRIELGEIESVLADHSSVREAAVIARESASGDKRLAAYVVAGREPAPAAEELRDFLRARLPDFMIPPSIQVLTELPLTPNGKLDRRGLPDPDSADHGRDIPRLAPRNEVEETIAAIWRDLLRVDEVGVHDNFFDLGGHSLLVAQVHRRLRERLKADLTLVDLFKHPTISALALRLQQNEEAVPETDDARSERSLHAKNRLRGLLVKGRQSMSHNPRT